MGTRRRVRERRQRLWNLLALATLLSLGIVSAPEPAPPAAVTGSPAGRTHLVAGGAALPAVAASRR